MHTNGATVLTPNVSIPFLHPVRYVTYTNTYNSDAVRSLPRVVGTGRFGSLPCTQFIENCGYRKAGFLSPCPFYRKLWAQEDLVPCPVPILSKTLGTGRLVSLPRAQFIENFGYRKAWFLARAHSIENFGHRKAGFLALYPFYRKLWAQEGWFPCPVPILSKALGTGRLVSLPRVHFIENFWVQRDLFPYAVGVLCFGSFKKPVARIRGKDKQTLSRRRYLARVFPSLMYRYDLLPKRKRVCGSYPQCGLRGCFTNFPFSKKI